MLYLLFEIIKKIMKDLPDRKLLTIFGGLNIDKLLEITNIFQVPYLFRKYCFR